MAKDPKEGILLYHLTALENLEGIIMNGLQPRANLKNFKDIADAEILNDREKFNLEEYTPFHFFPGSPFAGSVQITYPHTDFIFLTIRRNVAAANGFLIVPSHPLNYNGVPLSWNEGIDTIDWRTMALRNYSNQYCKEICMAEALYKGSIGIQYLHCIYTKTTEAKAEVERLFKKHNCQGVAFVNVNENFFVRND